MRISLESAGKQFTQRERMYGGHWRRMHTISLLPGPVAISERVVEAFHRHPVSHRSQQFIDLYQEMRSYLSDLMGGLQPVVLCGSGTLANDAVAANLCNAFGSAEGLVIANGEFGERLIRQANCAGLHCRTLQFEWGRPWNFSQIERELQQHPPAWIWAVHLETSTGVLNDLQCLLELAKRHGAAVAADCVSSLGAVELGACGERLFLATGVSGKAIASYAGLAFVFLSQGAIAMLEGRRICPTFDLVNAVRTTGPVSTLPSPLVLAGLQALRENYGDSSARDARYCHYEELGRWTRAQIRDAGLEVLAAEQDAAPTISTFPLPWERFAEECQRAGFRIAHESDYLRARGWGQIATMGTLNRAALEPIFDVIRENQSQALSSENYARV